MEDTVKLQQLAKREPLCMMHECEKREHCLRWILGSYIDVNTRYVRVLNPLGIAPNGNGCSNWKSAEQTLLARGFRHLCDNMPMKTARAISRQLQNDFTRIGFFRLKRGDRPLTTAERRHMEDVCREYGVEHLMEFDSWVEEYE